jgi:ribonuclease R
VGSRTNETFQLGDEVSVRLVEAVPTAGALRFEMLSRGKSAQVAAIRGIRGANRGPKRRRPGR